MTNSYDASYPEDILPLFMYKCDKKYKLCGRSSVTRIRFAGAFQPLLTRHVTRLCSTCFRRTWPVLPGPVRAPAG